jgi:hypothetical protein
MSPASSDVSMLTVAVLAPLRPTMLAVDSCTRQHVNLLVPGQIVSGPVERLGEGTILAFLAQHGSSSVGFFTMLNQIGLDRVYEVWIFFSRFKHDWSKLFK